jgi:hypothetical protein
MRRQLPYNQYQPLNLTTVSWVTVDPRGQRHTHEKTYEDELEAWKVVIGLTGLGLDAQAQNYTLTH